MKKLYIILLLSSCGSYQNFYDCKYDPVYINRQGNCDDKDHKPKPEPAKPVITDPLPGVIIDPPPPPPPEQEVCDGGARDCREGEEPTGTVSDPTKYL